MQHLRGSLRRFGLRDAAQAIIASDTMLHAGKNTTALQRAFCETGILEGRVCEALTVAPRRTQPDFRLHPNPASDHFWIHSEALYGFGQMELKIFDLTGREMSTTFLYGNRNRIDTAHLRAGVYMVQVQRSGLPVWNDKLIVHN